MNSEYCMNSEYEINIHVLDIHNNLDMIMI